MTEQIYTDKEILADALTAEKAATNNYNAFANECVHDSVRDAILHCLEQEPVSYTHLTLPTIA